MAAAEQAAVGVVQRGADRDAALGQALAGFVDGGFEQGAGVEVPGFTPGFADGRAALLLADAANESLRTGATVKVGP